MGNMSSSGGGSGRRRSISSRRTHPPPPPPVTPQPEITANPFVYPGAAPPYPPPHQYPSNSNPPMHYPQYHYPAYYPPPPPVPFPHHPHNHPQMDHGWMAGRGYPCGPMMPQPAPYVEHQKAVTIRNDVNIKKETLKIEPDAENPGRFLVSFTFDATVSGCITILFFAKEVEGCVLTPTKEDLLAPVTVNFQQGLSQKFKQPAGTGIDFSMFQESELLKLGDMDVYPLAVKAESSSANHGVSDGTQTSGNTNSQITQAVFEKERGEFQVKVVKQILWVNLVRYELQEIYGIRNSTETDVDESDQGKECVICLSEPRDTIVHPCRHMCMCSECAKVLRFQTNRCPICRQPVERLLQINVRPEE